MSLFKKKKNEKITSACACNGGCSERETGEVKNTTECFDKAVSSICCIKVLGSGCKNCHALLEAANEAVKSMGLHIEVEYVTDMQKIMEYGVMSMPSLVVNEQVVSAGKVLKAADVKRILEKMIA